MDPRSNEALHGIRPLPSSVVRNTWLGTEIHWIALDEMWGYVRYLHYRRRVACSLVRRAAETTSWAQSFGVGI
jgi:hypothetical protein